MNPIVSIVVPVFNAESYLNQCLSSLGEQTLSDIEILMIDDGSTDRSPEICEEFSKRDPRFVYIRQDNAGVSAARNKGIERARGAYIGFCDSDDWAEPDMYETLLKLARENDADIAVISCIHSNEAPDKSQDDETVHLFSGHEALLEMHHGSRFQGQLWDKLVKRELIGESRLDTSVTIFEDMLFLWELFAKSQRVAYQKLHRYHYIYNPSSALYGAFKESFRTVRKAAQRMLELMETHFPSDRRYAEKTLLLGDYVLAEKLAASGRLSKAEYNPLKADFDRFYNEETQPLFSGYHRKKISFFLKGRFVFTMYMRLKKLYGRIRR